MRCFASSSLSPCFSCQAEHDRRCHEPALGPLAANSGRSPHLLRLSITRTICALRTSLVKLIFMRSAHIMHAMATEAEIANLLGALSLAVMDRIEQGARDVIGRAGETPAALV